MEYEIRSTTEYIDKLKDLSKNGVDGYRDEITNLYYRGEPNDYGKSAGQPSIARGKWLEDNNESELFRECERRLTSEFTRCSSTFAKLVQMQHYGIPTRVLDISLDPLQALFFALYIDPKSKKDDNGDGMVLIYEVPKKSIRNWHSDSVSIISNIAVCDNNDLDIRYLPDSVDEDSRKEFNKDPGIDQLLHEIKAEKSYFDEWIRKDTMESIYCVHPLLDNPRIRSQQGAFLLFGINGDKHHLATLESNKGPEIRMTKIRIPQREKKQIREELKLLGKTIDTIYPDWVGVSDYFNRFYGKNVDEWYK